MWNTRLYNIFCLLVLTYFFPFRYDLRNCFKSSKISEENGHFYPEIIIKEEPHNTIIIQNTTASKTTVKKRTRTKKSVLKNEINICVICNKSIKGRPNITKHYLMHRDQKIKKNKAEMSRTEDNGFLRCPTCTQEFKEQPELEKHQSNYHKERPYMCVICHKCFVRPQHFITHMRSHKTTNEKMKCPECDFTTTFTLAYSQHLKSHPRIENPFTCQECGESFTINKDLNAHKRSQHPKRIKKPFFECEICQKQYTRKSRLKTHKKSHTGENIRSKCLCDICGKSISVDNLKMHKRIHSGYKPYACTYCEKSFTTSIILRDHLRVHSGEKPFACEHCGKCFSQRTPLTIHLRLHSGERPFSCHICHKGFVSKGSLGIHLKNGKH